MLFKHSLKDLHGHSALEYAIYQPIVYLFCSEPESSDTH